MEKWYDLGGGELAYDGSGEPLDVVVIDHTVQENFESWHGGWPAQVTKYIEADFLTDPKWAVTLERRPHIMISRLLRYIINDGQEHKWEDAHPTGLMGFTASAERRAEIADQFADAVLAIWDMSAVGACIQIYDTLEAMDEVLALITWKLEEMGKKPAVYMEARYWDMSNPREGRPEWIAKVMCL